MSSANNIRFAGGNVISADSEAVFYGVLDFLAKPIFGALLIWGHKSIDPARLGLAIKDYSGDAMIQEKHRPVSLILLLQRMANATLPKCRFDRGTDDFHTKENAPARNGHTNGHSNETAAV